jgi:hypothetical protein
MLLIYGVLLNVGGLLLIFSGAFWYCTLIFGCADVRASSSSARGSSIYILTIFRRLRRLVAFAYLCSSSQPEVYIANAPTRKTLIVRSTLSTFHFHKLPRFISSRLCILHLLSGLGPSLAQSCALFTCLPVLLPVLLLTLLLLLIRTRYFKLATA